MTSSGIWRNIRQQSCSKANGYVGFIKLLVARNRRSWVVKWDKFKLFSRGYVIQRHDKLVLVNVVCVFMVFMLCHIIYMSLGSPVSWLTWSR